MYDMIYSSKQNPIIKGINSLKEKKYRDLNKQFIVEGIKMVNEAIKYGIPINKIVVTEKMKAEILPNDFPLMEVSDEVFSFISDAVNPQGALAVLDIPAVTPKPPDGSSILLDGIRDPGNLGTIMRTAAAAGYKEIYLLNCCDAYNSKVIRSSMSGIYFVKLYEVSEAETAILLKDIPVIIADMCGENVFKFVPPAKYCIVIGNESNGVSGYMRSRADYTVSIPMDSKVESLNAGISCAVLMYQLKYYKGV